MWLKLHGRDHRSAAMDSIEHTLTQAIKRLEAIKQITEEELQDRAQLVEQLDDLLELLYSLTHFLDVNIGRAELMSRIQYFKELRAAALELEKEQVPAFRENLALSLSSLQYQLWPEDRTSLDRFLDSV